MFVLVLDDDIEDNSRRRESTYLEEREGERGRERGRGGEREREARSVQNSQLTERRIAVRLINYSHTHTLIGLLCSPLVNRFIVLKSYYVLLAVPAYLW